MEMMKSSKIYKQQLLPGLPHDLFISIVLKLDVKSLAKCLCVCKSWKGVISDPAFVDMHRDQSMLTNSHLQVFVCCYSKQKVLTYGQRYRRVWTLTTAEPDYMMETDRDIRRSRTKIRLPKSMAYCILLPVCCDLLCFNAQWDIYLCNPTTGELHTLPRPPRSRRCVDGCIGEVVFGYVASKREYTVVTICTRFCEGGKVVASKFSFSSSGGRGNGSINSSSWKEIEQLCPRRVQCRGILINNFVYCLIDGQRVDGHDACPYFGRGKNELIVSLDVDEDKFGIINCPPTPYWESHPDLDSLSITLIDRQGTLCLTDAGSMRSDQVFELWALKFTNYDSRCWVKEFNIKLDFPVRDDYLLRVYCKSSREGELIITSPDDGSYYLYNPEKNKVRIEIRPLTTGVVRRLYDYSVGFFWGSWFSFGS